MKKIKLLTPLMGLTALAGAVIPLASCSCKKEETTTKVVPEAQLEVVGDTLTGFKKDTDWSKYDTISVPSNIKTVGEKAFSNIGSSISKIVFNKNIRKLEKNLFGDNTSVTELDFSDLSAEDVKFLEIDSDAFSGLKVKGKIIYKDGISSEAKEALKKKLLDGGLSVTWFVDETTGNISVANKVLTTEGGTESYTYTLAKELAETAHIEAVAIVTSATSGVTAKVGSVSLTDKKFTVSLLKEAGLAKNDYASFNVQFICYNNYETKDVAWIETLKDFKLTYIKDAPTGKYTITFDSKGGSDVDPIEVEPDTYATQPANPTKGADDIFKAWYTDEDCTKLFDFAETKVTSDLHLFGGWTTKDACAGMSFEYDTECGYYVVTKDPDITGEEWSINELTIPDGYNGKPVREIKKFAFVDCGALTKVNIPNTIRVLGASCFQQSGLQKINSDTAGELIFPNSIVEIQESIVSDSSFEGQDNKIVKLPKSLLKLENNGPFNYADNIATDETGFYYLGCNDEGDTAEEKEKDKYFAVIGWEDSSKISNPVKFNENTKVIGPYIGDTGWPYPIELPEGLVSINEAFVRSAYPIATIYYGDKKEENKTILPPHLKYIGKESLCVSSTSVDMSACNELVEIGYNAFSADSPENEKIESVTLPTNGVLSKIGSFAFYRTKITSFNIPKTVTDIGVSCFPIVDDFDLTLDPENKNFVLDAISSTTAKILYKILPTSSNEDPTRIASIYTVNPDSIPEDYEIPTTLRLIGDYTFSGWNYSGALNVSDSVECIGNHAFDNCGNITSFVIDAENSQLKEIGEYAFRGTGITSLVLPKSLEKIGRHAFDVSSSLAFTESPFADKESSWYLYGCDDEDYEEETIDEFVPSDNKVDDIVTYLTYKKVTSGGEDYYLYYTWTKNK